RPLQAQLQDYLQPRRLLLILDNFEQLVDYTEVIVDLLNHAPDMTILITSRVRLSVRGETVLTLQGLSLPSQHDDADPQDAAAWQKSEAVALFAERAHSADTNFVLDAQALAQIAEICQLVNGLPLAIEMIAAWLSLYSCAEIAQKLKQGVADAEWLSSPYRDQPVRHQSLQRVFADSWDLLSSEAQWTLAKLSIFAGPFTRSAAQSIANATPLAIRGLHNHSLLQIEREGIYALHPLIKQFVAQKWQALTEPRTQERYELQQAHCHYYLYRVAELTTTLRDQAELTAIHSYRNKHTEIVRGWQWAVQEQDNNIIQHSMFGLLRYLELTNQSLEGEKLFGMAALQLHGPMTQWLKVAQCHFLRRL
ncbi:MAG: hypothetical protein KDE47_33195, partial [Caldilineaceae bacterium]|nr:hypothetical protein [Caldilineaceae bacterium]